MAVLYYWPHMTKNVVNFKGTRKGLLIMLDDKENYDIVKMRLLEKFQTAKDFFVRSEVMVEVGDRELTEEQVEELAGLIRSETGMKCKEIGGKKLDYSVEVNKDPETLMLKRTLRSGQRIYHDGNVVILGDVNPGAEVVATGDIVVFGTFRGLAHAGSSGNEESIIVASKLQPTQIRIAEYITRSPDDECIETHIAEVAKLKDDYIVIEPYST